MKKLIAILLTCVLVLNGCASNIQTEPVSSAESVEETANTESTVNDTAEASDDGGSDRAAFYAGGIQELPAVPCGTAVHIRYRKLCDSM